MWVTTVVTLSNADDIILMHNFHVSCLLRVYEAAHMQSDTLRNRDLRSLYKH